jgi:hypothetical protein
MISTTQKDRTELCISFEGKPVIGFYSIRNSAKQKSTQRTRYCTPIRTPYTLQQQRKLPVKEKKNEKMTKGKIVQPKKSNQVPTVNAATSALVKDPSFSHKVKTHKKKAHEHIVPAFLL